MTDGEAEILREQNRDAEPTGPVEQCDDWQDEIAAEAEQAEPDSEIPW